MARRLAVLLVLISFGAVAAETARPTPKVERHRWRCHFAGRMVFCDLVDKPLVTPPSSFR